MNKRVVIVDDEPITRMDLAGMLSELGYRVVGEAADGFDAAEVCRAQKPDIVLLDVRMPVFDGFWAAETILKEELAGCVIFLTAYNDRESIERAKEIGVAGYLVKPVEQRLLLPTIEVSLAQSERLKQTREETLRTRRELDDSKLIHRAQSVLAEQEQITQAEAYRRLRQMAMEKRTTMVALAQALLEQDTGRDDVLWAKKQIMKEKGLTEEAAYQFLTEQAKRAKCSRKEYAQGLRRKRGAGQ